LLKRLFADTFDSSGESNLLKRLFADTFDSPDVHNLFFMDNACSAVASIVRSIAWNGSEDVVSRERTVATIVLVSP
jgi:hypothetical protein